MASIFQNPFSDNSDYNEFIELTDTFNSYPAVSSAQPGNSLLMLNTDNTGIEYSDVVRYYNDGAFDTGLYFYNGTSDEAWTKVAQGHILSYSSASGGLKSLLYGSALRIYTESGTTRKAFFGYDTIGGANKWLLYLDEGEVILNADNFNVNSDGDVEITGVITTNSITESASGDVSFGGDLSTSGELLLNAGGTEFSINSDGDIIIGYFTLYDYSEQKLSLGNTFTFQYDGANSKGIIDCNSGSEPIEVKTTLNFDNTKYLQSRNNADDDDINLIGADSSDVVQIADGGLQVTSAGIVSMPENSACRVTKNDAQTMTADVFTLIQYDDVSYDNRSEYDNTTNYDFTAAVDGIYNITASVGLSRTDWSGDRATLSLFVNGTEVVVIDDDIGVTGATFNHLSGATNYKLSASDVVTIKCCVRNTSSTSTALAKYNTLTITKIA